MGSTNKTDLAKVINSWRGHPDIVSKGSQKNFVEFAKYVGAEWARDSDSFNEAFYRQSIAQAIIFRETERLVSRQPWYQGGGIRSRVVPYAIAKLEHDAAAKSRCIDFESVWRAQSMPQVLCDALTIASKQVHEVIVGVGTDIPNPLEWAKQQACWNRVKGLTIEWPKKWFESLLTVDEQKGAKKAARKEQKVLNGIEAQTLVINAGQQFWRKALEWASQHELLTPTDIGILGVASSPGKLPSEKQCIRAVEALRALHQEGFAEGRDLFTGEN